FTYYAVMLFSKVPAFGWYFVPPLPLYYAAAALGIADFGLRIADWAATVAARPSSLIRRPSSVNAAFLLLALALTWHLRAVSRDIAAAQRLEDEVRRPIGEWLAANTPAGARVMLEPIGYIG